VKELGEQLQAAEEKGRVEREALLGHLHGLTADGTTAKLDNHSLKVPAPPTGATHTDTKSNSTSNLISVYRQCYLQQRRSCPWPRQKFSRSNLLSSNMKACWMDTRLRYMRNMYKDTCQYIDTRVAPRIHLKEVITCWLAPTKKRTKPSSYFSAIILYAFCFKSLNTS